MDLPENIEVAKYPLGKIEVSCIKPKGEINIYNSGKFKEVISSLIDNKVCFILINFQNVSSLDTSGLGVLVETMQKLKKVKGDVKLSNMNERLKKAFILSRLDKIFEIFENEETALQKFLKS